jgi:FMN phosphatase YigB (HAD superfamily)
MKVGGIEALLFDLGRVVIDIDFDRAFARWAKHASCDDALLRARFLRDAAFCRHEMGKLSDDAYFASLRASLGIDITNAQLLDGWNAIFVGEMHGIFDHLSRIAPRIPLYAFSNSNRPHEACWSKRFASVLSHFREIYVSSTIGLRKPDADAYEYVVKAIGVPSDRILFFDDSLENIAGAQRCGLQTVHVTSSSDVDTAIARLGL